MARIIGDDQANRRVGTGEADFIDGRGGDDDLFGRGGNDEILGGAGRDELFGEAGSDILRGGSGDDSLNGGGGNDRLFGGDGNDVIRPGLGFHEIDGGLGTDTVSYAALVDRGVHVCSALDEGGCDGGSADSLAGIEIIEGSAQADEITDSAGSLIEIRGLGGDDQILGFRDDTTIWGDSGNDRIANGGVVHGGSGDDEIVNGSANGTLLGETGADTIRGGSGNDHLDGGSEDDVLDGGAGNDRLSGGSGKDSLTGNGGRDLLLGGSGGDFFDYSLRDPEFGFTDTLGGRTLIRDFVLGSDRLSASLQTDESFLFGREVFELLDSNGNAVLDNRDAHVTVADVTDQGLTRRSTILELGQAHAGLPGADGIFGAGDTLTVFGVIGLVAGDFL